jgi:hypothetical protein
MHEGSAGTLKEPWQRPEQNSALSRQLLTKAAQLSESPRQCVAAHAVARIVILFSLFQQGTISTIHVVHTHRNGYFLA